MVPLILTVTSILWSMEYTVGRNGSCKNIQVAFEWSGS